MLQHPLAQQTIQEILEGCQQLAMLVFAGTAPEPPVGYVPGWRSTG